MEDYHVDLSIILQNSDEDKSQPKSGDRMAPTFLSDWNKISQKPNFRPTCCTQTLNHKSQNTTTTHRRNSRTSAGKKKVGMALEYKMKQRRQRREETGPNVTSALSNNPKAAGGLGNENTVSTRVNMKITHRLENLKFHFL